LSAGALRHRSRLTPPRPPVRGPDEEFTEGPASWYKGRDKGPGKTCSRRMAPPRSIRATNVLGRAAHQFVRGPRKAGRGPRETRTGGRPGPKDARNTPRPPRLGAGIVQDDPRGRKPRENGARVPSEAGGRGSARRAWRRAADVGDPVMPFRKGAWMLFHSIGAHRFSGPREGPVASHPSQGHSSRLFGPCLRPATGAGFAPPAAGATTPQHQTTGPDPSAEPVLKNCWKALVPHRRRRRRGEPPASFHGRVARGIDLNTPPSAARARAPPSTDPGCLRRPGRFGDESGGRSRDRAREGAASGAGRPSMIA